MRRNNCLVLALFLTGWVAAARPASGQIASLVRDIESNTDGFLGDGSFPRFFQRLGDRLLFFADDPTLGTELWVTDGTSLGTKLLADSCPGECDVCLGGCEGGSSTISLGEELLFWRTQGSSEAARQLWRTDGTPLGTFSLTAPGVVVGNLGPVQDGLLYFQVAPEEGEVWISDGTPTGTRRLVDIAPDGAPASVFELQRVASRVVFFANHGDTIGLWSTDGTELGTRRLRDFDRASTEFLPDFASTGSRLFWMMQAGPRHELWSSDGTHAGTRRVRDFPIPSGPLFVSNLVPLDHRVAFSAFETNSGQELWVSDGSATGTLRVTSFTEAEPFGAGLGFAAAVALGEAILFLAKAGAGGNEVELWRTDGNPAHTTRLTNLCPGACGAASFSPLVAAADRAYFVGQQPNGGVELWASDGTAEGTGQLRDVCPGECGQVSGLRVLGETAYFVALADNGNQELWRSQGSAGTTRRVTTFSTTLAFNVSFSRGWLEALGDRLLFAATEESHGTELWTSDGTPEGSRLLRDLVQTAPSGRPSRLTEVASSLLFVGCQDGRDQLFRSAGTPAHATSIAPELTTRCGNRLLGDLTPWQGLAYFIAAPQGAAAKLWVSDATATGTQVLAELPPRGITLPGDQMAPLGDGLFFVMVVDGELELWRTNGTALGTFKAVEVGQVPPSVPLSFLSTAIGRLFFVSPTPSFITPELWCSDGTQAGTVKLSGPDGPFGHFPDPEFAELDGRAYFAGSGGSDGFELWSTDGSPGGTMLVNELFPGPRSSHPEHFLVFEDHLYFFASSSEDHQSLFRTDGTSVGTVELRSFRAPRGFGGAVAFADRLYFAARDEQGGIELWTSNGNAEGTLRFADLFAGAGSSSPTGLTVAANRLFFAARDGAHGTELWVSDGTPEGTRRVHDLAPGPASSNPESLTVAGNRLYFTADDGIHGRELWSLDLSADPTTCPPSDSGLCLQNNRFRVEINWRDFQGNTGRGMPVPLTADTGYFWFFNPANVETIVKVLDGRPINDHFWTFYGALSNVEYTMTVTDAQTGLTQRYFNPSRQFASVGDTESFGPNGASLDSFTAPREELFQSHEPEISSLFDLSKAGSCAPSSTRLCLNNSRFAVEATWTDFQGNSGVGMAEDLTADTGYFWFFRDTNVEVVLKVLDGRPLNGKFWVFYGALSNVEYTLTVTDTETGMIKTYFNPSRRFGSVGDTGAF